MKTLNFHPVWINPNLSLKVSLQHNLCGCNEMPDFNGRLKTLRKARKDRENNWINGTTFSPLSFYSFPTPLQFSHYLPSLVILLLLLLHTLIAHLWVAHFPFIHRISLPLSLSGFTFHPSSLFIWHPFGLHFTSSLGHLIHPSPNQPPAPLPSSVSIYHSSGFVPPHL